MPGIILYQVKRSQSPLESYTKAGQIATFFTGGLDRRAQDLIFRLNRSKLRVNLNPENGV